MARIHHYISFSEYFRLKVDELDKLGIFDPILNADTPLFIDPLLLPFSKHKEINTDAKLAFEDYFGKVITLLKKSKVENDLFWRNAINILTFPEVKGICLGYGGASVNGRGSGQYLTNRLIRLAKEVIEIGYEDPNLFPVLAILEPGIGPDRISDMTAKAIEDTLCVFTQNVAAQLSIPVEKHRTMNGRIYNLPTNPYPRQKTPVILVPLDILRKLPIAKDWDSAVDSALHNEEVRHQVNTYIGMIFEARTKKEREEARRHLRDAVLTNAEAFKAVVAMVDSVDKTPYDFNKDPDGQIFWRRLARNFPRDLITLVQRKPLDLNEAYKLVSTIIERFRFWLEERRVSMELWNDDGTLRKEKSAQRLFFMVADDICKHNNLDISPETDSGGGPVDFKFSLGYECRIVVELKLSTNSKVVDGYTKQLESYKAAEDAHGAYYVIIDVGEMGKKQEKLFKLKNGFDLCGKRPSELVFIDGLPRKSASRL